ncbi:MAG: hypothetical protein ACO3JG_12200 [Luteolibacter sp.]
MRVHLVTYATPRFYLRQTILGLSARINHVADTVTSWNPERLRAAGFERDMPGIDLAARGSGFWAWKPYIIAKKLAEVPDGDMVFYCDVGRRYPYKTLEHSIAGYLEWMRKECQEVMPGLHIPWKGPMSMWTKRAAFHAIGLDEETAYRAAPIQASFSLWIAGNNSRRLSSEWFGLCSIPTLINDDPSPGPLVELPDFFENRHDQSLLSLCSLKAGIRGIDLGTTMPDVDTQHPDEILDLLGHQRPEIPLAGKMLEKLAAGLAAAERLVRRRLKFGEARPEPTFQNRNSKHA